MNKPTASTDAFAARLQALRKKNGIADERVLHLRCAVTGNGYSVRFSRESPALRYRIAEIDQAQTGGGKAALAGAQRQSFRADEFDLAGWRCPHCGDDDGFVICSGCGENVCRGRTRTLPHATLFACHDGCGESFETAACETVAGETARAAPRAIGHVKPKMLPPVPRALPNHTK